jgi:NitT/TauT family transport system ATP-binding protein
MARSDGAGPPSPGPCSRIELADVSVVYGAGAKAVVAVDRVSLSAGVNELVCVIGPSGCGKSTLLKAIAGLLPARMVHGRIAVGGRTSDEARRANAFAYVFQDPVLAPWRSCAAWPASAAPARRPSCSSWSG